MGGRSCQGRCSGEATAADHLSQSQLPRLEGHNVQLTLKYHESMQRDQALLLQGRAQSAAVPESRIKAEVIAEVKYGLCSLSELKALQVVSGWLFRNMEPGVPMCKKAACATRRIFVVV